MNWSTSMSNKVKTSALAKKLDVSPVTINRLSNQDKCFPVPIRIGREKYFCSDSLHEWLQGRASNEFALKPNDKIISGAHFLELVDRSKGWLWLNVIKPKSLTRINLSPDPESNKLINYFIEREVYAVYGDLIEVARG